MKNPPYKEAVVFSIAHLILFLAVISPLLFIEIPPLVDLPNHLARWHILANFETESALQKNYQISSVITPNVLVDWILTPLVRIWCVYEVGRAFIVVTMALTYAAVLALHFRFFSQLTLWPAIALPILYNHAMSWGFINFSFGIALALLFFACWLYLNIRNVWGQFCTLSVFSGVLYLTHMLAFGTFAAITVAHRLSVEYSRGELRRWRFLGQFAIIFSPFVIALFVYFFSLYGDGLNGEKTIQYGGLWYKEILFLSPFWFTGGMWDKLIFFSYFILGISILSSRNLIFEKHMITPIIVLIIICISMPETLFGVTGVDFRFPPILLMLAIAATRPRRVTGFALRAVVPVAICSVIALRTATLWPPLQAGNEQFIEFREATSEIPEGTRVLATLDEEPGRLELPTRAYWHLVQIAVIERNVFVPFMFTGTTQLRPSRRNELIDTPGGRIHETSVIAEGTDPAFIAEFGYKKLDAYNRIYWAEWPKNFDVMIRINPGKNDHGISKYLYNTHYHSFFQISRIKPLGNE